MAVELIRFIAGALIVLIPGIWLAGAFSLGSTRLDRWTTGSSLGLALAVYSASAVSHIDLRIFYPLWGLIAVVCFFAWFKSPRQRSSAPGDSVQIWMVLILLLVAVTRFAIALPRVLPAGPLDPTFHLILARQIQITHHAIDRWPFANIPLNYPTGGNTLVVVLAAFSGIPLHTVFKDLIPLLGVLTTAQMFVFTRRITSNPLLALYSAAIYGLWAWFGSIDYFRWGGLPNELAMLLFITMLSIEPSSRGAILTMILCFAAALLVHHHVMVVSSIILFLLILWQIYHRKPWRHFAIAISAGIIADAFFLVPYALHLANFRSTGMVVAGEPLLSLMDLPSSFGYALICLSIFGIILALLRKIPCPPIVAIASISLVVMFVIGEDIVPLTLRTLGRTAFTFFTPSRFLTDLNYFLPIFAAGAVLFIQQNLRLRPSLAMIFILLAPLADYSRWMEMFSLYNLPPQIIDAADWIQHNTPSNTIVDNQGAWMTYLCWREPAHIALPVSEPVADYHAAEDRIPQILSGQALPDSPGQLIVKITDVNSANGKPVLWQDPDGAAVIQEYPDKNSR